MGYQAKDHFHTPRKQKDKKRPKQQDIIDYADELASGEKTSSKRTKNEIQSNDYI